MDNIHYDSVEHIAKTYLKNDIWSWAFLLATVAAILVIPPLLDTFPDFSSPQMGATLGGPILFASAAFYLIRRRLIRNFNKQSFRSFVVSMFACNDPYELKLINEYAQIFPEVQSHITKRLSECDVILEQDVSAIREWGEEKLYQSEIAEMHRFEEQYLAEVHEASEKK